MESTEATISLYARVKKENDRWVVSEPIDKVDWKKDQIIFFGTFTTGITFHKLDKDAVYELFLEGPNGLGKRIYSSFQGTVIDESKQYVSISNLYLSTPGVYKVYLIKHKGDLLTAKEIASRKFKLVENGN